MTDVLATARCPRCAALVRDGQPWCTLCHADLRPADLPPAPTAVPDPVASGGHGRHATVTDGQLAEPLRPASDPLNDPLDVLLASAEGGELAAGAEGEDGASRRPSDQQIEAMLSQLALETTDPLVGASGRFGSRPAKVMLALGVGVGFTALLLLGAAVAVAIFG